jgi:hypothetical protein
MGRFAASDKERGGACYLSAMRPVSSHSQHALAAGLSAAALIAVAACGSATTGGPAGTGGPGGGTMTPQQALAAAATSNRQVTSATETLQVKASGLTSETTSGTILIQLKPTLQLSADLSAAKAGKTIHIKEVLTGQDVYFGSPALTGHLGKPWVRIPLSALKGTAGASFAQLLHGLQSSNFNNQTELLTVAKNAREVGTQTVAGVPTTEYAGSVRAAQATKALSPSFRKALAPELSALGNTTVSFHIWIDGQHHARKLTEAETVNGENVNTTVYINGINQPVHIVVPPASQTTSIPGL